MDAWEDESPVRPIPIEDDDGLPLPVAGRVPRNRSRRRYRPWLPLVISGAAVVALVSAVAFLGAVQFQDVPAINPEVFSLTTNTDPEASAEELLPPTLEESIPGVDQRLTLVTTDGDALWTLVWDPSFRAPKPSAVMTPGETVWSSAAFDAGGRVVAATGAHPRNPLPQDVWLGSPTQINHTPDIQDTYAVAWHATELSRLAFVRLSLNAGSEPLFQLWTTTIDITTNSRTEPTLGVEAAEPPTIVRWDGDGFVLQIGQRTLIIGPKGDELWCTSGRANERWQSGFDDRRRPYIVQRWPDNYVEMHPDDAKERGIESGDMLMVCSDRVPGLKEVTDRKSTRLNSSHTDISYAVFCSKKKKQNK